MPLRDEPLPAGLELGTVVRSARGVPSWADTVRHTRSPRESWVRLGAHGALRPELRGRG